MGKNQTTSSRRSTSNPATLPTFMDHVLELQGRLFAVAIVFLIMACLAYPFFDTIVNFLIAPLGDEHELVYLTPAGAFSFIIKVCMYVGAVGALPFIIYHLYRFLLPAVKPVNIRRALGYTIISLMLALTGLSFAYFVSLPAALYFLTSFNLHHINPMLTIDSYFSFIMTYMLAGALLFQLPLIITIINNIKPLTPGGMMRYQRHLIVGSFIIAAIISPTPDALNQTLLAMPVVLMYQISICIVWLSNRKRRQASAKLARQTMPTRSIGHLAVRRSLARPRPRVATVVSIGDVSASTIPAVAAPQPVEGVASRQISRRSGSIDGFGRTRRTGPASAGTIQRPDAVQQSTSRAARPAQRAYVRSVDGFMMPSRPI